jgi:beta-galactosidase
MYHQGIVVYEAILPEKRDYKMRILLHDFGLIYVDDEYVGNITRTWFAPENITVPCKRENCTVKIVVEAMGHVNYHQMQRRDRKGIVGLSIYNYTQQINWKFSRVLLNNTDILSWFKTSNKAVSPSLLMGAF